MSKLKTEKARSGRKYTAAGIAAAVGVAATVLLTGQAHAAGQHNVMFTSIPSGVSSARLFMTDGEAPLQDRGCFKVRAGRDISTGVSAPEGWHVIATSYGDSA